jgi:tetratricopeptide (TPR) repeat protein
MYEALTGKAPFGGDNAIQTILHHVQDKPAPLSCARADLPPGLEQAIMQTLEKQPNDRFQSIDELSDALEVARNPHNFKPRKFAKFSRALRKIKAKVADHSKTIIIGAAAILVLSSFSALLNALAPHEDWRILEQKGEDAFSVHDFDHAFEFWHSAVKEAQRSKATPFEQEKLDFDIASTLSRNATSHPVFEELARPYYDQLLAISAHHPEVLALPPPWLYNCASSIQTENPAHAEMLYKRLIKQMEFMGRDASRNEESIYSAAWMGLGSAQSELGKNKDAESAFKRSLTIAETIPNSSEQVAEILDRLSKFYKYQGRDKEAEDAHQKFTEAKNKADTERPKGHT